MADNDDSKSILLDEFTNYLVPDLADQIWQQISNKLGRRFAEFVRNRYLDLADLRRSRDISARVNWTKLFVKQRKARVNWTRWRWLADGALEHKEQRMAERMKEAEEQSKGIIRRVLAWFTGAAKNPKAKPRTVDEELPAKKYKLLFNLRHPALDRHPRGYRALFGQRPASMPINDTPINDIELRRRLAAFKSNGWQAVDVVGDGNCFFRALAKQLDWDEQEHGFVRQETIRYMREHREDFDQFVHGVDFDSYVDKMSIEGTYVEGQLEIQAAADAFNVRIVVYGQSRDHDTTIWPLINNSKTGRVYMAHFQARQHYMVLEQMDPTRGGSPLGRPRDELDA